MTVTPAALAASAASVTIPIGSSHWSSSTSHSTIRRRSSGSNAVMAALAPGTTMIALSPEWSTLIAASPLGASTSRTSGR